MTKRELLDALVDVPDTADIRTADDRPITGVSCQSTTVGTRTFIVAVWLSDAEQEERL